MNINRFTTGILSTILLCLSGPGLIADDAPPEKDNNLAMLYFVDVKAGHEDAFLEAIAEHAAWRRKAADPWDWDVFQVVVGENLGQYIIRSGGHSWEDFDKYEAFDGPATGEWNKNVAPHIVKASNAITANDAEVVNWLPEGQHPELVSVISYDLKPGHGKDFSKSIRTYHEAIMKHGYDTHYSFSWKVRGGAGTEDVHLVLPATSYADMAGPEEKMQDFMGRVLGEEEAEAAGKLFAGSIRSSKSIILRYKPELSVHLDR